MKFEAEWTQDRFLSSPRINRIRERVKQWRQGGYHKKLGLRAVYDLSATPFFLKGSGYPEGTLFPWVVSDFSLIDAIESGIVKIPRVPVEDNSMTDDQPTYRDLWPRIREDLPKKGRKGDAGGEEPNLPAELERAIRSLYHHYEKSFTRWNANTELAARGGTPPVFVMVCNNTSVSNACSTTSPAGRARLPTARGWSCPASSRSSTTSRQGSGRHGRRAFSWIPSSSNPARA